MEQENKLQLKERSIGLIATVSDQEASRDLERKLTIQGVIENSVPINELRRFVEPRQISIALDIQLTRLVGNLNLKWSLNDSQIKTIVEDLLDKHKSETLEDFMLCFKKARLGEYGELIRLDSPIVFSWMEKYLDEKYRVIEETLVRQKDEFYKNYVPVNSERDWLAEWQKALPKDDGVQSVPRLTEKEIDEEGQEKPKRPVYQFNESEAQIKLRETRERIYACQEQAIRERHNDWSEDQIQQRLKELREFMIYEESKPKFSPVVDKIFNPKKKKQA
jgi:hypothetical protein